MNPRAKEKVTITVTQEELYVLHSGLERMSDLEDGEFANMRRIAGEMELPRSVLTYADLKA